MVLQYQRRLQYQRLDIFYWIYFCINPKINKNCDQPEAAAIMASITQTSYISSQSRQTSQYSRPHNLYKIQSDVFNRVVNLKNEKIQLLQQLSDCIDRKYQAETELIYHLEIKKKKQQNLASPAEYEPVVYRNIELKAQIQQLERQVLERANSKAEKLKLSGHGDKSRAKSVYDLTKSRPMQKSYHSKSKASMQNSKIHKSSQVKDNDDYLIDQILQQRKANSALMEIIREQKNQSIALQKSKSIKLNGLKLKVASLWKLVENEQITQKTEKLSRSVKATSSSKILAAQQNDAIMPVTVSFGRDNRNSKVEIEELKRYIVSQEEQKTLLYAEIQQAVLQRREMEEENQRMKIQLAEKSQ